MVVFMDTFLSFFFFTTNPLANYLATLWQLEKYPVMLRKIAIFFFIVEIFCVSFGEMEKCAGPSREMATFLIIIAYELKKKII